MLYLEIKNIENSGNWSTEEIIIIENALDRFNKMSNVNIDDNKSTAWKQNDSYNDSNKLNRLSIIILYNDSNWRKLSNYPSFSTNIDHNDGTYTAPKSNWRNKKDRCQYPSQYVREGIKWRSRQNKNLNV